MKLLIRNIKLVLILFLTVSLALLGGLVWQQHRAKLEFSVATNETPAALAARYARAGSILGRDGSILAQTADGKRTYHTDPLTAQAMIHLVGDHTGRIGNTIETQWVGSLTGTDRFLPHQLLLDLTGHGLEGDDVILTADPSLSRRAAGLLSGLRGAIVLLDYQTGEVIVSVSSPGTSPSNVFRWENIPDTALFDRARMGAYAPGSVFKIVTAAAWLDAFPGAESETVLCKGFSTVDPEGASEKEKGHGEVTLEDAFTQSCNVFFGQIGVELGLTEWMNTAQSFMLGSDLRMDRMRIRTATLQSEEDPATLSWLAIGQPNEHSTLRVSPMQLAMMAGAVGNGGILMQPRVVDHVMDPRGMVYKKSNPQVLGTALSPGTAARIEDLMILATQQGTGSSAAVKGLVTAGKTGTVQVEGKRNTALYAGYLAEESYPYAIAVVVEEGGAGSSAAAPLAREMFRAITGK